MCCPFSFSASCGEEANTFTFSKVILSPEETNTYQVPWETQQKSISKQQGKRLCLCWCCLCTCLCKPVSNRRNRRVSNNKMERRAVCYKKLISSLRPNIEKVQLWSKDFEALLADEDGRLLFEMFLRQEHSDENLQFWIEVDRLKTLIKPQDKKARMMHIYFEFVRPLAEREINLSSTIRKKIEDELSDNPSDTVFDVAQNQVSLLMFRQSYPRFLVSDLFNAVVQSAHTANVGKVS
ncbi:regulator of G-protein signaling 13 isoform X2 [Hydra vulgaris]|uniref:Regulator of G-protein signaling 13 isoform X2 n=2 Tax=Hydra vulgaris TaxID=6087 RepID=A0ABM4BXU2_HYDVU|nr:regulator of G-protein signaling 13 isoform X2 [Hydra vulgaris]